MTALVAVATLLTGLVIEPPPDHGPGIVEVIDGRTWYPAGDAYVPAEAPHIVPDVLPPPTDPGAPPAAVWALPLPDWLAPPIVLSAEEMIRERWAGNADLATMLRIADRESGFDCAADNPSSSAAGLFQTLALHRPRAERLGLAWSDITGPDCTADIALAWDLYAEQGTRPWALTRG
jgi:hypothetical protein